MNSSPVKDKFADIEIECIDNNLDVSEHSIRMEIP